TSGGAELLFRLSQVDLAGNGPKAVVPEPSPVNPVVAVINAAALVIAYPLDVSISLGAGRGDVRIAAEYLLGIAIPNDAPAVPEGYALATRLRAPGHTSRDQLVADAHQSAQRLSSLRHSSAYSQFS